MASEGYPEVPSGRVMDSYVWVADLLDTIKVVRAWASRAIASPAVCNLYARGTAVDSTVWQRGSLVALVESDDGARVALLQLDAEQPVVLEGSAAAIWSLINGRRTANDIVAELREQFAVEGDEVPAQLADFLTGLALQRLIEPAP
ncbi:Coenzyme PQQ synthesis protein D [Arthrobacter ulcerisalmonis]|uniref:Coenzyme PQQ synthesis protein D n=1 Tax=Arthrobacter ulcerisalmonis TaxID=2483813 RepID=A0A3P5X282_9MICC|nr:Coenzyme PQQ synthesis protein D [Arthrobacter ulcerisalmonis]